MIFDRISRARWRAFWHGTGPSQSCTTGGHITLVASDFAETCDAMHREYVRKATFRLADRVRLAIEKRIGQIAARLRRRRKRP